MGIPFLQQGRAVMTLRRGLSSFTFPSLLVLLLLLGGAPTAIGEEGPSAELVGDETCLVCHEDVQEAFAETPHAKVALGHGAMSAACESCHGPGSTHAEEPTLRNILTFDPEAEDEGSAAWNAACLDCHEKGGRTHWRGSVHDRRGVGCVSCHTVMKKVSERSLLAEEGSPMETCFQCHLLRRAQNMRSSHMPLREGAMDCMSCHQPHGGIGPSLLAEPTVARSCYRCHAEKRGPFLWEHPPVREDCSNCHAPHGSMYERLLIRDVPRLCMQCHNATRHPTTPRGADSRFVFSRGCLNCHPAVHGSNHPSGYRLQR